MQTVSIQHSSDKDQRLDKFLKKYLPNAPLGLIYKLLRTGKIKVNSKKKDQTYKLLEGDIITFWLSDDELTQFQARIDKDALIRPKTIESPSFDILYEDAECLVINKPAGINVHPGDHKSHELSLIELVHDALEGKYDSLTFRPALLHRIDRDTSGCIMIVKEKNALEKLLFDLQNQKIEKYYHALVRGAPVTSQGTFRDKLLRIEHAKNEAKVRVDPRGQTAITNYALLDTGFLENNLQFPTSLLICQIETGRTHQIRVHLSNHNCPILGDDSYGDKKINAYLTRHYGVERQLLHAQRLVFTHPVTQKRISVDAPYPKDFQKIRDLILKAPV